MTDRGTTILVLGLGNLLQADDGVGIHVIRALEAMELPAHIALRDGGTIGLSLLTEIEDCASLVVVDAMELSYAKEHIDTFVIVSGDSDFTPLVGKLKENGKTVIGLGMKDSTSELLATNCDEFIYYEDIGVPAGAPAMGADVPKKQKAAFKLLFETIEALQRENVDAMHSSLVKDTIKRKQPSFAESAYGYKSFTQLLEDAQKLGYITLHKDSRSGTYVVEGFASDK